MFKKGIYLIRLENFSIKSNTGKNLIKDVNLFIPSGSTILIIGKHSIGKTMLARVIGLIDKPAGGNLYLLGKNISRLSRSELSSIHNEIGIVFQENYFINEFDLETNIIFPLILKNEKKNDIAQALRELLPWLSLEKVIKEKVCKLSMAELKLAQFARAIIGRPRILLLDSFFKDVDNTIKKKINYLILALKKIGTTVIVFGESPDDSSINFNKKYEIYNKNLEER
ncbi:MAG: ATP-binding cassette domain-containing protein [Alphaproteobacteria bacterium TMED194]|nr:MAG: ATP-binding cassette domain-containing protein [Alphaproteobacteria bacterium TMED194]